MAGRSSRWQYIRLLAWRRDNKAKAVCHICGKPTHFGTICPACMTEQKRKERHGMVGVNSLLRDEENRMQFIGNKEHKES